MSKHTLGPWEVHQEIGGRNSVRVCVPDPSLEHGCRPVAEAEIIGLERSKAEANARLIAAAPDLLKACKLALGAFEHNHAINWDDLAMAIAKAEGR